MPKLPKDYSRTVQYKIVCNDLSVNFVYNGHTTDFVKRKNAHKSNCNNPTNKCYNLKVYQTIREIGGWDSWSMIEIEKYPCKDSNEARARERYWYEQLQSNLNMIVPNRSSKERGQLYYQQNKDKILENTKQYNQDNKDKIKEYHQIYYQENRDKILEYHQLYNELYYKQNKERMSQPFTCECGSNCRIDQKLRHQKSQKHLKYLEQLKSP